MKRLTYFLAAVLVVMMLLPMGSGYAQTSAKKSLPQVPITYPGDTDETIIRRAQWIEGAKKEGVIDWWGILPPGQANGLIAEFKKIYPFITVNYWRGRGEEVAAKLDAEVAAGRSAVDITLGAEPYNYSGWRPKGIFEKVTDIIPQVQRIDKRLFSKYHDWAVPGELAATPAYNTNKVTAAEAPKSWEDLLDPKWKGQIGLTTDVKVWITLALGEGAGAWGIEKTEDFLKKLKQQQIIWAAGHTAGYALMTAGEFKIFGESYLFNTLQAKDKGSPAEWSRVRPVAILSAPFLSLPKKAPHPNAARLLVEWIFSPRGLVLYDKITDYGSISPGSGTRLAAALEGSPFVYWTEEGGAKAVEMGLEKRFSKLLGATPD